MPWRNSLAKEQLERQNHQLWRTRKTLDTPQSVEVVRNGKPYLNFCSNDYLGLANHPAVIQASRQASKLWGTGSGASHLVCGHQHSHQQLELELADFVGAEKALLFSTGYMANLAVPQCFLGRQDLLLQDKLNHASMLDAAKLCPSEFKRFRHADTAHATSLLSAHKSKNSQTRRLISTDAVFSMDGDIALIEQLDCVAAEQEAVLLIDDAHGFGVLGKQGRGTYSKFGLAPTGHRLMLGTLGKALGSFGAFVAGDQIYINQLEQHSRTYIYTTALPSVIAESTRAALTIVRSDPSRIERLTQSICYLRSGIKKIGLDLMPSDTAIQPIVMGDETRALQASEILDAEGIWVSAIRPPTVAKGSSRLRITICSEHKREHLDGLLTALEKVQRSLT